MENLLDITFNNILTDQYNFILDFNEVPGHFNALYPHFLKEVNTFGKKISVALQTWLPQLLP